MILTEAIRSRIPLIRVRGLDRVNDHYLIQMALRGCDIASTRSYDGVGKLPALENAIHLTSQIPENLSEVYEAAANSLSVVLHLDYEGESDPAFFDAGSLEVGDTPLHDLLEVMIPTESLPEAITALRGLTLSQVAQVVKLSATIHNSFKPRDLFKARKLIFKHQSGLHMAEAEVPDYYEHGHALESWFQKNHRFFLKVQDRELMPRGLLFDGPPGTGKTLGAKYLANKLGVSMFRLDIAAMMTKWLGEGEANLRSCLQNVEACAPCVLVIDEVEKAISTSDDGGTGQRMLGTLLWWLQEHTAQVLTIMTTNRKDILPPELYREGRIDRVITFPKCDPESANNFMAHMLKYFHDKGYVVPMEIGVYEEGKSYSEVVQRAREWVKEHNASP